MKKEHIGYKVVTEDLKSLGLRNNPTILTYEPGVFGMYCRKIG